MRAAMQIEVAAAAPQSYVGWLTASHSTSSREHAGVLEQRLHLAVIAVAVAVVGGEELAAVDDLVAHRRDVVRPATAAEKAQTFEAALVAVKDTGDVAAQLVLRAQGRGQVEEPGHAKALGNRAVQLLDALHADRVEHGAA